MAKLEKHAGNLTRAAVELAKDRGAKRAIKLPVSAPFHCALMAPAADVMADALANVSISKPLVPFVSNVTASVVTDISMIPKLLVEQVTGMVRWRESVLAMKDLGVETLVEVGVGKVLSGLNRRIDKGLISFQVGTPKGIEEFLNSL